MLDDRQMKRHTAGEWRLTGGRILANGALTEGELTFADGTITGSAGSGATTFDASGCLILPGIIDIHGDAFERNLMPRPGVTFGFDVALGETDRQLVSNGITTAFHGLTVSWEPGLRSLERARAFHDALCTNRPYLTCDTHLHVRWETFALDAMQEVANWLSRETNPILAFNDHTTKTVGGGTSPQKVIQMAERSGLSREDFSATLDRVWGRRDDVPEAIARMAALGRDAGATLLAHDEGSIEDRRHFRALGAVASEFPLTRDTAKEARDHGEHVILGAPNVVRGGSHTGAVTASEMIAAGLCSVLASDYYYPAPFHAAFKLAADGVCSFPEAWSLISENAAQVAGLNDRGRLDAGLRADVVVVDNTESARPRLRAVFVNGRPAYTSRA